jgi:Na+/melibiose symporter-like transporter
VKLNKILTGALIFLAIFMVLLGMIFVIASGIEYIATGGAFIAIAVILLYFSYRTSKVEAAKPSVVNQTFQVKMEGSGDLKEKELRCKSCGAPLTDKNLKVIQGGVMMTCPYCGAVSALEEAPKW